MNIYFFLVLQFESVLLDAFLQSVLNCSRQMLDITPINCLNPQVTNRFKEAIEIKGRSLPSNVCLFSVGQAKDPWEGDLGSRVAIRQQVLVICRLHYATKMLCD